MSEEAELRECNEAFESEEGDVDPFLEDEEGEEEEETESSREMMERLRELEVSWKGGWSGSCLTHGEGAHT